MVVRGNSNDPMGNSSADFDMRAILQRSHRDGRNAVDADEAIPHLLALIHLSEESKTAIGSAFEIIYAPTAAARAAAIAGVAKDVRVVLTNGSTGLTAVEMDTLGKLELVCALGAGYENIDGAHTAMRGFKIATGAGTVQ